MSIEGIGEVRYFARNVIDWTIPSFTLLSQKKDNRIWSPSFVHCAVFGNSGIIAPWVPEGFIELTFFAKDDKGTPVKRVRFGIADINNSVICCSDGEWGKVSLNSGYFKVPKFVCEKDLKSKWNYFKEKPRFRLFCEADDNQESEVVNVATQTDYSSATTSSVSSTAAANVEENWKCTLCTLINPIAASNCDACNLPKSTKDKNLATTSPVSSTAAANIEENWKCTLCTLINPIAASNCEACNHPKSTKDKNLVTHEVRRADTDEDSEDNVKIKEENSNDFRNLERLSENLKQLYIGSKDCDLTIQVQDRQFKVHRAILRSRSPVFDAMFTHGLSESNSGIVPIEDSEPAVIEEFLCFVYAGRTQNLSSHNACELYYVADKYDVPDLKEKCISFLKKSLTVETICDVICLATKHNETKLLEHAILFFAKYMEEILVTVKWQVFMKENPTEANELYIKVLKLGFSKRNF